MSVPYVCPSCRHNVYRQAISLRALPKTPKASFISLSNSKPPPPTNKENASSDSASENDNARKIRSKDDWRHDLLSSTSQRSSQSHQSKQTDLFSILESSRPGRYSGLRTAAEQAVQGNTGSKPANAQAGNKFERAVSKGTAVELDEILESRWKTTSDAWQYFDLHYKSAESPALKSPALQDINKLSTGVVFLNLLNAVLNDWHKRAQESDLPTPVEIVSRYLELKIMRHTFWAAVFWTLNVRVLAGADSPSTDLTPRSQQEIVAQLMELWSRFFDEFSAPEKHHKRNRGLWSSLPPPSSLTKMSTGARSSTRFEDRLYRFIPKFPTLKIPTIPKAVMLTYDTLTREDKNLGLPEEILVQSQPFVNFVAHLIPMSDVQGLVDPYTEARFLRSGVPQEEISALIGRLKESGQRAVPIIATSGRIKGPNGETLTSSEELEQFFYRRIARAAEQEDADRVFTLWRHASSSFSHQKADSKFAIVLNKLYNLVLESLIALRRPEQALEVWNDMIADGTPPTIVTWTAMLTGCRKAKDIIMLEELWARMLASGIKPDAHAWSTRIYGLMQCGQMEKGLECLEEMGRTWLEAVKHAQTKQTQNPTSTKEVVLPVRPTVEILNTVVTVLSRTGKHRLLGRVLAWGRSYGIKPDVVTFNALISMSLRQGNAQEAMTLLKQMDDMGVKPDVATFAIILNSIFRRRAVIDSSEEEQNAEVIEVLRNLEARGLEANAWVYSTLIDGLLKVHGNLIAAKAVLHFMHSKKIPPSPHVYTILMTHYFAQRPTPDYAAIEALWNQIQATDASVDAIFYDRMVESYAAVGDVGRMMAFLTHMSKVGKSPGWPALEVVVRHLAAIGDWDRFQEIVEDVRDVKGVMSAGLRSTRQNVMDSFWRMVERKMQLMPKKEDSKRGGDAVQNSSST